MRRVFAACFGALLVVFGASAAQAKLNVFACVPEWAALTTLIGGATGRALTDQMALATGESHFGFA